MQGELNELEHDISLRRLLWKSIDEWDVLIKDWLSKLLDEVKVDMIQKDVNRFTQNIYLLEKGKQTRFLYSTCFKFEIKFYLPQACRTMICCRN